MNVIENFKDLVSRFVNEEQLKGRGRGGLVNDE